MTSLHDKLIKSTISMFTTRTISLLFNFRHIQFVPHLIFIFLCLDQIYSQHPSKQPSKQHSSNNLQRKQHILQTPAAKIVPATIPTPFHTPENVQQQGNYNDQHVMPDLPAVEILNRVALTEIQYKTVIRYRKKQVIILCILYAILTLLVLSLAITLEYLSIVIHTVLTNHNLVYASPHNNKE